MPFRLAYLQIALSNRCDLRCPVCIQSAPKFASAAPGDMTEETFARIVRGVRRGARPDTIFLFWNDEPTLHPRFAERFAACLELVAAGEAGGLVVSTNARRLARFAATLAAPHPALAKTRIVLSLDAASEAVYRRQRGDGFSAAVAGAEALLAARGARAAPALTFQMVITAWNVAEAERFAAHWAGRTAAVTGRAARVTLSREGHAGDLVHLKCAFPWDDAEEAARARAAFLGLARGRGDAAAAAEADAVARPRGGEPCAAMASGAVVHPDGTVSPCCVDFDRRVPLGHLGRDGDLFDVVSGTRAANWRAAMASGRAAGLPERCRRCRLP